jgi:hypothetical protein
MNEGLERRFICSRTSRIRLTCPRGPEKVLEVEKDLDADAGRPFGLVGAVVDGDEAAGGKIWGQLHGLDLEVESKLVVGVGVVLPAGGGRR